MTILLPAVAFAASCVWLTMRIVNRRARWAKWTLAAAVSLPVIYVASFGPWCWIRSRTVRRFETPVIYGPIAHSIATYDPSVFSDCVASYASLGIRDYTSLMLPDGFRLYAYQGGPLVLRQGEPQ